VGPDFYDDHWTATPKSLTRSAQQRSFAAFDVDLNEVDGDVAWEHVIEAIDLHVDKLNRVLVIPIPRSSLKPTVRR
jgi:hypothetical protein